MKKYLKLLFLFLIAVFLLIFGSVLNVNASVSDNFTILLNGNAVGYGDTGSSSNGFGSPSVYETNVYTPTTSENGFRRKFTFYNTFSLGGSPYPLSFVDIYSANSTANECSGVGCNIAYQIPVSLKIYCDNDDYCGLGNFDYNDTISDDTLCTFSGSIYFCNDLDMRYPLLTDLSSYFSSSMELKFLYNLFTNNGIQFYYKNMDNRLLTSDSYVDLDNIVVEIKAGFIVVRERSISNGSYSTSSDFLVKGKIYNNQFSDFESLRLFFNYPYNLQTFVEFNKIEMSFTNFNVNTTITGTIPDFPENPSLTADEIADLVFNDNVDDSILSGLNSFFDMLPFNTSLSNLFRLVPDFLITLYDDYISGNSCTSYNLGSLYGNNIILPCIDIEDILGSSLWHTVDILISIAFIYNFRFVIIDSVKSILFLKTGLGGRGDIDD